MKMRLAQDIRIELLPSLALINLHLVPKVPGIGIIYSELSGLVIDLFEGQSIRGGITAARQQNAFNIDPECRLSWLEIDSERERQTTMTQLREQYLAELR